MFAVAGAAVGGTNAWGDPPAVDGPGVYVISLTNDIDRTDATLPIAPVSWGRINTLLARRPELGMLLEAGVDHKKNRFRRYRLEIAIIERIDWYNAIRLHRDWRHLTC